MIVIAPLYDSSEVLLSVGNGPLKNLTISF